MIAIARYLKVVLLLMTLGLAAPAVVAQGGDENYVGCCYCDFNNSPDTDAAFFGDLYKPGATSGSYADSRAGMTFTGWTWQKDGDNLIIRDNMGAHVMTFCGRANFVNHAGAITDGPSSGDNGGNWWF